MMRGCRYRILQFMNKELKQMIHELLSDDELWQLAAKSCKKNIDVLMEQGFTRKEAIKIFLRQGSIVKGS